MSHGKFDMSIHLGTEGVIFTLNMDDDFRLAISYYNSGITSIDAIEWAIKEYYGMIVRAIFIEETNPIAQTIDDKPNHDNNTLEQTLSILLKSLPENPSWAMISNKQGQIIAFAGEMHKWYSGTKEAFIEKFSKHIKDSQEFISQMNLYSLREGFYHTRGGIIIFDAEIGEYILMIYYKVDFPVEIIQNLSNIFLVNISPYRRKIYQILLKMEK